MTATASPLPATTRRSPLAALWKRLRRNPVTLGACGVIVALVLQSYAARCAMKAGDLTAHVIDIDEATLDDLMAMPETVTIEE